MARYASRGRTSYSRSRVRSAPKRSTRRAPVRRRSSGRASYGPRELRIVIEQSAGSAVSRYPGVAAKLNPLPRKAKF